MPRLLLIKYGETSRWYAQYGLFALADQANCLVAYGLDLGDVDRELYRRGVGDCGQLEKPNPVGKLIGQPRRHFQRQAGFADPTHPGQSDQAMSLHRGLHLAGLRLASDEAPTLHIGGIRPQTDAPRRGVARHPLGGSQRRYGTCWLASGDTIVT
jgi:hypothetical protein